jgi:ABC-2 type transport system permease protein
VIIGPPVFQLLVFGYAATFDLTNVPFAVYNESPSEVAQELMARFRGSSNFNEVATITHDAQIAPLIDNKQVLLVVHIGPRFSRDLRTRGTAAVQDHFRRP